MKNSNLLCLAASLLASYSALAAEVVQVEETSTVQKSETQAQGAPEEERMGIKHLAIRPQAGVLSFNDTSKFAGGLMFDANVLSLGWMKVGPSFGALYSPLNGGDFFEGLETSNNNYVFQIPANVKITASPDSGQKLQLGVHGGANIVYSTVTAQAINGVFGNSAEIPKEESSWDVHPNVGADIDYAVSNSIDISARPDWTFTSDFDAFTGTLGIGFKL